MTPIRITFVLFLLIVVMLTAGCMIGDRVFSIPSPTTTPIPTITRIPSPQDQPSGYWIDIDYIGDKQVGDIFAVHATTNLSAGEPILFEVVPQFHHGMKNSPGWYSGDRQISNVTTGQNGMNATSFTVNTSSYFPDVYFVTENAISENASDFIKLNITDKVIPITTTPAIQMTTIPTESSPGYWIKIDPISDKQKGDSFTINATTNLSVNDDILIQVYSPPPIMVAKSEPEKIIGVIDHIKVIPGRNGENFTSFNINLTNFPSDEYLIIESAFNETVTGTSIFNVL